jgi:hypothetical protein
LRREGGTVDVVQADLATIEGVDKLYAKISGRPVAALLANAGRGLGKAFLDQDFEKARYVLDTNVTGTIYLIHKIGRDMRSRGEGRILIRVEPFLLTHEIVEKALLDELRLHYLHAHQIAVRAERDAVKAAGISWGAYQSFMKKHEKPIEEEKLIRVPPDRDLTPYRDEKDFGLLERMVRKEKSK